MSTLTWNKGNPGSQMPCRIDNYTRIERIEGVLYECSKDTQVHIEFVRAIFDDLAETFESELLFLLGGHSLGRRRIL